MNLNDLATLETKLQADLAAIKRVRELLSGTAQETASTNSVAATNGASPTPPPQPNVVSVPSAPAPSEETAAFGEVTKAVTELLPKLAPGFTIVNIEKSFALLGQTYVRSSIRGVLGRMERQGKITITRQGEGRRPTEYKVTDPQASLNVNDY